MRFIALAVMTAISTTVLFAGTGIPGVSAGVRKFKINNAVGKNAVKFVSKAPAEDINGTADGVSGSFELDPSNIEAGKGTIEVEVRSMKTAMAKRDEHMYSPVWLDADKYPTITFTLTRIENVKVTSNGQQNTVAGRAIGTFTMHGVTKPLQVPITLTYLKSSEETKKRASGDLVSVKVGFVVPLKDYDVKGKEGVIGNSVGETIACEVELFANS